MTVRKAELFMALIMASLSGYLMWKSAELPIGWIADEGPGGGAWPFWLATVMLLSCGWILVNWVRRTSWPSKSEAPFFESGVLKDVSAVAIALTVTIALFDYIGAYLSLFFFIAFYVGVLGRHRLLTTALFSVLTPIITFFFFEIGVKIILPKGFTEPFFFPIFKFFGMGGL